MKYALTSSKWEGEVVLEFHDNGQLKSAQLPEVFDAKSLMFFASNFPVHVNFIPFYKEYTGVKVTEILMDLNFEAFWNAFDKKTGPKPLAQQYWDGDKKTITKRPINDTDRMAIMTMVKRYAARYKGNKKEFQPLASTFLHQRYWESEMETVPRRNEAVSNMANELIGKMAERITSKRNENNH
jgi:hypothetical protein